MVERTWAVEVLEVRKCELIIQFLGKPRAIPKNLLRYPELQDIEAGRISAITFGYRTIQNDGYPDIEYFAQLEPAVENEWIKEGF